MTQSGRLVATVVLLALPGAAHAQQARSVYLGVTAGAHVERAEVIRMSAPAVGVVGGVEVSRNWAVEVEFARPTRTFVHERTCQCFSFASTAADFASLAVTERIHEEREVFHSVSIGAVYQPAVGRWRPRAFFGATRHHVEERVSSTILSAPPGFEARAEQTRHPSNSTRGLGGPTVGGGLGYQLTPQLSVGGDVRFDYGSIGDEINNTWRTSMRTMWSF